MTHFSKLALIVSMFGLMACGGGGGSSSESVSADNPPSASTPSFTVSTTDVMLSGKQFEGTPPMQRITFTSIDASASFTIAGDARTPSGDFRVPAGERIFSTSADSSGTFVDVTAVFTDVEGGTYEDVMTIQPTADGGGNLPAIQVNLTLVQEPTAALTAALDDPETFSFELSEGGAPIRIPATVTTGNTIRWEAQPFAFDADGDLVVLTSDPAAGTGTEQVDLILTPTPSLIDSLRQSGIEFAIMGFQDIDHPGNFTEVGVDATLSEEAVASAPGK